MPCIVEVSPGEESRHFQTMLCLACKYLTIEQIESLKHSSAFMDGMAWYKQHLLGDYCSINSSQEEKQVAFDELHRLGYEVEQLPSGAISLKELSQLR